MLSSVLSGLSVAFMLLFMLVGLFGLVIPVFPGGLIIWLISLAYGLLYGFQGWGLLLFILITAAMVASLIVDDLILAQSARREGAAWRSLAAAFVGGLLGTFFFPPFGGLVASPLFLYISEYLRERDRRAAWQRTRAVLTGWGWSFLARFGLGMLMIALWSLWVWITPAA